MNMPTRKSPLWHFEYNEVIDLQRYGVARALILTIFQQHSIGAHMFCYYCVKYYFNIEENFNCPIQIPTLSIENVQFSHKGGFLMVPLI